MDKNDLTYLSILLWPEGVSVVEQAETLVSILDMDPCQAGLAVRRGFPQVLLRVDPERAEVLADDLRSRGIEPSAAPRAGMRSVPSALRIAILRPAIGAPHGMYECEPSRGAPFALLAPEIALLVRASVVSPEFGTPDHVPAISPPQAAALSADGLDTLTSFRSARTRVSEILDLFLRGGSRLRIEADRFNFDLVGEHRPRTDRQRLDALARRLAAEAPGAVLDKGFAHFHCPADFVRTHHAGAGEAEARRSAAMAAFDFYSAWLWLHRSESMTAASSVSATPAI